MLHRITWTHSIVNPVLYGFMLKGFRTKAKHTFDVTMVRIKRMSTDGRISRSLGYTENGDTDHPDTTRFLKMW